MTALRRTVEAFDATIPIERAVTPPSSWYIDEALWQLERASVFRDSWQPLARLDDLEAPGSYVSGCFAGEPWLATRDRDGALRAFYNTCRHKGREVVIGAGRADRLVCGYHAWSYDLDGRLRQAPRMAGVEGFAREQMSLVPLASASWGHWLWIRRGRGTPLAEQIEPLGAELDAGGWTALTFAGRRSWTIACNWKVYVDNYLDGGYHVPHMHPTLAAQIDMSGYRTETFARCSIQTAPPKGEVERIGARAIYAWIYPNIMLNRYGPCLDTNHVVPLGPDRCRVDYEFYFADTGAEAERFVARSMEQSDVTQREDIAICESVQRGLASESYERGRYAPSVEIGEHHFHCLLAADFRAALGEP